MKHILFVIDTLRMGGAEKSLISLLKSLDSDKVNVDLFLFEHGGVLQSQVPEWINIIDSDTLTRGMTLELRKYLGDVIIEGHLKAALARILMTLKAKFTKNSEFNWKIVEPYIPELKKEYDVAIGYLEGFPDFFVLDKVNSKKKIGWIHIDYSGRSLPPEAVEYYNRFDELVTISNVCKNAFIGLVPEVKSRIQVLENIVLPDEIRKKAQVGVSDKWNATDVTHIVSVGRLDYQKGMDVAARTAKVLVDRKIRFCWHVYGKGVMQEEIKQYVKEQNLEGTFVLEGLRENPYPYMKKADVIVQPSRFEGKSIVLDEAKILGKSIVVTDYPSVNDQIKDRVTGLITGMEPESIADGIEEILSNPKLKERLEQNALNEQNNSYQAVERFYQMLG